MTTLPLMESPLLYTTAPSVYPGVPAGLVQIETSPRELIPSRPLEQGEQYRFHFDMTKCIGCKCCVVACNELRRIADVADKYHVPMVKVTGSQRLDLLGVKKADLPNVWRDLGMPSGQAYSKGVRMVKTCVGTEFCRFGVQDSTNTGIELERRLENLFTPHKVKMGAVGGRAT